MGPVYHMLGMTAAYINETTDKAGRRRAYEADATYLTARESGFDYLRGFLAFDPADLVQRPFNFAIIDEADSILIDEARIPLVIAGDMPAHTEIDKKLYKVVASMKEGVHFNTDENGSAVYPRRKESHIEKQLRIKNLYDDLNLRFCGMTGTPAPRRRSFCGFTAKASPSSRPTSPASAPTIRRDIHP